MHSGDTTYKMKVKILDNTDKAIEMAVEKDKNMSDLFIAVKTDEAETPLGVGKSLRDLEQKLGLKKRTLEYCFYHGIPNKRLKLSVRRVKIA